MPSEQGRKLNARQARERRRLQAQGYSLKGLRFKCAPGYNAAAISANPQPLPCRELQALREDYYATMRAYVHAMELMQEEDLTMVEWERRLDYHEQCGIAFKRTRDAFNEHAEKHGCWLRP